VVTDIRFESEVAGADNGFSLDLTGKTAPFAGDSSAVHRRLLS
jgi:hypothetical protein